MSWESLLTWPADLFLWTVGAVLLGGVVAARGHEIRFAATNYQQGAWFEINTHSITALLRGDLQPGSRAP